MAHHGRGPAGERRGHHSGARREQWPNEIHTAVQRPKLSRLQPPIDDIRSNAGFNELRPRDDTVLARRECGDRVLGVPSGQPSASRMP